MLVLIFAIFPAKSKNQFPQITITANIFPAKIYSKVNFYFDNLLFFWLFFLTFLIYQSKFATQKSSTKKLCLFNYIQLHTVVCFKKYVFLLHLLNKNENMISEKLGRINFWLTSFSGGLGDSVILANDVSKMTQLNNWLLPHLQSSDRSYWKLCFRASIHGWRSRTFHSYCDNKGPTVTIVRVGIYIFGGYNDNSWQCKSVR